MRGGGLQASMSLLETRVASRKGNDLKHLSLVVVLAGSVLVGTPTTVDPVVYCGVVAVNSITFGQGSGPRTLELLVTSGPAGGGRFSVSASIPFPTVGSYICGQFEQGVPMNGLMKLLRPGETGYVAQAVAATIAPVPSAAAIGVAPPQTGLFTLGSVELLLLGFAVLVTMGVLTVRSRRSTA
jgi:hypothetical protein